jgi:hypothetical protein
LKPFKNLPFKKYLSDEKAKVFSSEGSKHKAFLEEAQPRQGH